MLDALPTDRNYLGLVRLIPGTTGGGSRAEQVGGAQIQEVGGAMSIHGSRGNGTVKLTVGRQAPPPPMNCPRVQS